MQGVPLVVYIGIFLTNESLQGEICSGSFQRHTALGSSREFRSWGALSRDRVFCTTRTRSMMPKDERAYQGNAWNTYRFRPIHPPMFLHRLVDIPLGDPLQNHLKHELRAVPQHVK